MADAGGEAGISEIAEHLDLALPTIHRLMRTLVSLDYTRQLPSRRYALGPRLVRLGHRASHFIGEIAHPYLAELVSAVGETANMATLDGDMVLYVAQVPSRHSMRMFTEVGRRVYLHSTGVGKALLSQVPDERVQGIIARLGLPRQTDRTITDRDMLHREIAKIREVGYAIDDGEQEFGVRCFAVPVPRAPTPTAISVSGPDARVTTDSQERFVPILLDVAARLGADLAQIA